MSPLRTGLQLAENTISEMTKALMATSASGAALQAEDLEPQLVEELLKLQPLLQLMSTTQATARVHEIARRISHGTARFEGELVDNRTGATVGEYDRPTVTLKVMDSWGAVSGFQQAASRKFINSLETELQGHLEGMANHFEYGLLWANSVDPYQIDGFDTLIRSNIINHAGVVTLGLLDAMRDQSTRFRGTNNDPGIYIVSKGMATKISGLQTLARIPVENIDFDGGLRMTSYNRYPILETDYVKPAVVSPSTFAGAAAGVGTLAVGAYRYRVAAVYETGEQIAAASTQETVNGSQQAQLTWDADADAMLFKIYRSDVDGGAGTEYLYKVISGKTRDSDGKITGNVTGYNDVSAQTRPDGAANELPLNSGEEMIFFLNLNPRRGASLVSLVNSLGEQVNNLVNYIELARTRASFDFMLQSLWTLQVPWETLHAKARKVKVA